MIAQRLGAFPLAMSCASPSTMAVLPTPGSPMSTGLFFLRRVRTLHDALDFLGPADGRIELALGGELGQVAAEMIERRRLGLLLALGRRSLRDRLPRWAPATPCGISVPRRRRVSARAASRFTPASVSTCAAMPFSSRSRPEQQMLGADVAVA